MKIREGFISNSSSSSFIIACKGELGDEHKQKIIDFFGVKDESPLSTIANAMASVFIEKAEEWKDEEGYYYLEFPKEYINNGFNLYSGSIDSWTDSDSSFEETLYNLEFEIRTDDFLLMKDLN